MLCCQLFAAGSDTYTSYGYCETITPDSGYQMAEGSLTYSLAVAGGETVKITGNRFTMPAGNVTITCKWETATTTVKGITSFSINGVAGAVNNSTNIGNIAALGHRGTECHAANAAAACAGGISVCAVIEAAIGNSGQTALQEGVAVTAIATGASGSPCSPASTTSGDATGGSDAPRGQHRFCQHRATCMAHIDAKALHEAVDFL